MKTLPIPLSPLAVRSACLLALCLGVPALSQAAEPSTANPAPVEQPSAVATAKETETKPTAEAATEAQPYVLFTGTDIQIQRGSTLHSVWTVEGDAFIIKTSTGDYRVEMSRAPEKLKLAQVVRVTEKNLSVVKYKHERSYTTAADPRRKWTQAMQSVQGAWNDQMDEASMRLANTPRTTTVSMGNGGSMTVANVDYARVQQNYQTAKSMTSTDALSPAFYMQKMQEELSEELFDALDLQFEVSAGRPVKEPYLVVFVRYHEKDQPKYFRQWIHAKALPPIDGKPQQVRLHEGGFTAGYVIDQLQVHLYERGVELATELSENRAPLNRAEAHEYLVLDHVTTHKGQDLKAQLVLRQAPEGASAHAGEAAYSKTYYVRVDKTGHPVEAFEDADCSRRVADPYYGMALKAQLFLPALKEGEETESVARVKFNELGG